MTVNNLLQITGEHRAIDLSITGLTGATAGSRYVGATTSGAPVSGTFLQGDYILDRTGAFWVCTAPGTPGTWLQVGSGVSTFNGRSGAVAPTSGDYTAAQVTNAADKSSGSQQNFTGELKTPDLVITGLTGATAASRYVGATASGSPVSGTFAVGDFIVDQSGVVWICSVAGSPGTWVRGVTSFNSRTGAVSPTSGDYTAAQVTNAADKSSVSQQSFAGELRTTDLSISGLTGATAASRYVGATTSGAPTSGPFLKGDYIVDQTGSFWVCVTAGNPGTWAQASGGGGGGGVTFFNGRTGPVTPLTGDYTAAMVTNAADKGTASQQLFTAEVKAPDLTVTGLTGATAAARWVGGTVSGTPTPGTFAKGDFVIDQTAIIWVCTTAGSPGTWTQSRPTTIASNTQTTNYVATFSDAGKVINMNSTTPLTFTVPPVSATPWLPGTVLQVCQFGSTPVTVAPGAGVILHAASSLTVRAQWSTVTLRMDSNDIWIVGGDAL